MPTLDEMLKEIMSDDVAEGKAKAREAMLAQPVEDRIARLKELAEFHLINRKRGDLVQMRSIVFNDSEPNSIYEGQPHVILGLNADGDQYLIGSINFKGGYHTGFVPCYTLEDYSGPVQS